MPRKKKEPLALPKRLAAIEWRDCWFDSEVHTEEQLRVEEKTCIIYSVGFIADDSNEDIVTIAMDYCPHGNHYRHVCRIRRENIVKITEIGTEGGE